jgi:hypothetical protein
MFRKNYVFIGHQASGNRLVFYKHRINKQELREYLNYLYSYYNLFAVEYYTVKEKRWFKPND